MTTADMQFEGRIAVITGGASGIGWELAQVAASLRMRIVLADIQTDALEAAAAALIQRSVEVLPIQVNVSKPDEVDSLADAVRARFGTPHLLFNNAGVSAGGLIWEHTVRDWEWARAAFRTPG